MRLDSNNEFYWSVFLNQRSYHSYMILLRLLIVRWPLSRKRDRLLGVLYMSGSGFNIPISSCNPLPFNEHKFSIGTPHLNLKKKNILHTILWYSLVYIGLIFLILNLDGECRKYFLDICYFLFLEICLSYWYSTVVWFFFGGTDV